jgi:hypothetical protein
MTDIGHHSKQTDATPPVPCFGFERPLIFQRKADQVCSDLFVSAKTATAIPVRHPALRDALIQASLDPLVRSIAYIASTAVTSEQVELDHVVIQRDEGRFLLDVVPARSVRDVEAKDLGQIGLTELGLRRIILTTEEIRREPRYTNTRLVWSYRESPVPVGLRMLILQMLLDEGPVPLGELLKNIRSDHDPAPAVMALACADLLHFDLVSRPLSPTTIARYHAREAV